MNLLVRVCFGGIQSKRDTKAILIKILNKRVGILGNSREDYLGYTQISLLKNFKLVVIGWMGRQANHMSLKYKEKVRGSREILDVK